MLIKLNYTPSSHISYLRPCLITFLFLCLLVGCTPLGGGITPHITPASTEQITQAVDIQTAPPCILSELTGNAAWQGATGALAGRLEVVNYGKAPCRLQGQPKIKIFNQNAWQLPVEQTPVEGSQAGPIIVLDPAKGNPAAAAFTWRNWCTAAKQTELHLEVTLPAHPGKLEIPVQDPNGRPLGDTPLCDEQDKPSTLQVENFLP
jgi:Protein of unknown function (DUF4232)